MASPRPVPPPGEWALAESAKTLAWRYAVGGNPFPVDQEQGPPDDYLVRRLTEVVRDLDALSDGPRSGAQITQEMREMRSTPLADRKAAYESERIDDQQEWYRRKGEANRVLAGRWSVGVLSLELIGVLAATARVAQWVDVNLLGLAAAGGAAATAWLQTRQHQNLATAYSIAAQELASIRSLIRFKDDENSWAAFVEDAEEAISREHTLWRASRGA